eukprot:COSAG06_NODE_14512_length_1150_cov_1.672693_1_plen_300_part_00
MGQDYELTGPFTMATCVKAKEGENKGGRIFAKRAGSSMSGWEFVLRGKSGQVSFMGGGKHADIEHAGRCDDGQWHHIAITCSVTGDLTAYIDGVVYGKQARPRILDCLAHGTDLYVGGRKGADKLVVKLSRAMICDAELSSVHMTQLALAERHRLIEVVPFTVSEWSSFKESNPNNRPENVRNGDDLSDNSYWCALEEPDPFIVVELEAETKLQSIKYVSKRWTNSGCPKVLRVLDHHTGELIYEANHLPDASRNSNMDYEIQLPNVAPAKKIQLVAAKKYSQWFCFLSLEFRGWRCGD